MKARRYGLHGVFLGTHAVAEGHVTREQLQRGRYRRLLQNVYADPGLPIDHQLYCRGAALVLPPDGVLAGRSAATWFGAPFAAATDPVLVIVPSDSPWRGPRGIRVHRTHLQTSQMTMVEEDIPVTTPPRTAWDVAAFETISTAVGILDGMARAGVLSPAELSQQVLTGTGRWRSRRVARVAPLIDGRSQSPPESWVRVACALADLPAPVPQYVVEASGVFLGEVDLAWPEARLIVEYEGEYHFDELQIRKDDRRYARLTAAGWRVIRLSSFDLRDLEAVVARIRAALTTVSHAS